MKAVALLVAAGSGERLGADRPKAFVVLAGRPMLEWSLEALAAAGIDLDDVTAKLLRDGIDAFMVPMQKLLDGIEAKRAEVAA